jgi:U3 small nucleolar RNA-associated protein 6
MLAELKDLDEKGLFSPIEIKHIIKKRTAFEIALVRRIPNKNDYLRYATYEMGLEALRRKRVARLSLSLIPFTISNIDV